MKYRLMIELPGNLPVGALVEINNTVVKVDGQAPAAWFRQFALEFKNNKKILKPFSDLRSELLEVWRSEMSNEEAIDKMLGIIADDLGKERGTIDE